MRTRNLAPAAALVAVAALALSGCVDNSTPSGGSASNAASDVKKDDTLANQLPDTIKSSGRITVGMDDTYPPNEFKDDNGQPVGWEVDLANAIAAKLGVKVNFAIATNSTTSSRASPEARTTSACRRSPIRSSASSRSTS